MDSDDLDETIHYSLPMYLGAVWFPKNFIKFSRFPVTLNLAAHACTLNIDKKITNCIVRYNLRDYFFEPS